MWRFEDLKTSQDSSVLWLVVCCHFVISSQFWRLIAFDFYFLGILNLLRVMLFPLVRRDWRSPWVWKTRSQSFGRQLVIWLSILPVWGMWFLITLPLPSTHLEPQHDRLAGNSLKIWRNKRPRLLKTRRFDGPTNKISFSQKPSVFPRWNPLYPTTWMQLARRPVLYQFHYQNWVQSRK